MALIMSARRRLQGGFYVRPVIENIPTILNHFISRLSPMIPLLLCLNFFFGLVRRIYKEVRVWRSPLLISTERVLLVNIPQYQYFPDRGLSVGTANTNTIQQY